MPNAGEICGIIFYLYREKGAPHHLPHVMVKYGEYKGNFCIETGKQLNGRFFPVPQQRIISKVLTKNRKELIVFWNNLQSNNPQTGKKIALKL